MGDLRMWKNISQSIVTSWLLSLLRQEQEEISLNFIWVRKMEAKLWNLIPRESFLQNKIETDFLPWFQCSPDKYEKVLDEVWVVHLYNPHQEKKTSNYEPFMQQVFSLVFISSSLEIIFPTLQAKIETLNVKFAQGHQANEKQS